MYICTVSKNSPVVSVSLDAPTGCEVTPSPVGIKSASSVNIIDVIVLNARLHSVI